MSKEQIDYLLSPEAIRERTFKVYELAKSGKTNFQVNDDKLQEVSNFVLTVIKENYPDLNIPFHSRWGHFKVGGINRVDTLDEIIKPLDNLERARIKLDLVITSVLLDAGAGPKWQFNEDGKDYNRSEGLGVASFHMFMQGAFSEDNSPTATAEGLSKITAQDVEKHFQVTDSNPLVGATGRASLLCSLGKTIKENPQIFKNGRPGNILDYLIDKHGMKFSAKDLLRAVLDAFGPIWPSRLSLDNTPLGDIWSYKPLGEGVDGYVPFHKLSQWLTYSLIEPIIESGVEVTNVAGLTGLAEYRNGGLLLDSGLIELRDASLADHAHRPDSEIIIEWRALTVVFLDKIGKIIQESLNRSPEEFPLAKVLEGGTWWAGRRLAAKKRADSSPPLKLDSDGTVF